MRTLGASPLLRSRFPGVYIHISLDNEKSNKGSKDSIKHSIADFYECLEDKISNRKNERLLCMNEQCKQILVRAEACDGLLAW